MALSKTTLSGGFFLGCALMLLGVYLMARLPATLIVAGAMIAGYCVLLAPIEDKPPAPDEESSP